MDVIAILACAMAVFYYLSWRRTQADLNALCDAVQRVAHGKARIQFTQLIVDHHAQRLKGAGRRMLTRRDPRLRLSYHRSELARGPQRARRNDGCSNTAGESFFTEIKEQRSVMARLAGTLAHIPVSGAP